MKVTDIKEVTKTKFKVYLDQQFAFTLYKGELFRYKIQVGEDLSPEIYTEIHDQVVLKRAKLYAMHLLNDMDRTESGLRSKLKQTGYPDDIAEAAISYVKSFGYINDESYVKRFIESKSSGKSKKEIYALLLKKGISPEGIQEGLENYYDSQDALTAIRDLVRKKHFDSQTADDKEKQRIYAYLARKGFSYEDIRQVLHNSHLEA